MDYKVLFYIVAHAMQVLHVLLFHLSFGFGFVFFIL